MEAVTMAAEDATGLYYSVTPYLAVATVVLSIYVIYRQMANGESWEKYGVKEGKMGLRHFRGAFAEMLEKHGDTVGFKRSNLLLLTRDLDLLKQIMVKDFNNFVDRNTPLYSNSLIAKGLFFQEGESWRRIRQLMSPSFSTGKLKQTAVSVDETARKLTKVLEESARNDEIVEIKTRAGQYTTEIIAKTAFGLNTDSLGKEEDEFSNYCKSVFKKRGKIMSKVMLVFFRFPWLQKFLVMTLKIGMLDGVNEETDLYLNSVLHRSIAERRKDLDKVSRRRPDFLQSLVSATFGSSDGQKNGTTGKTLTEDELIGQSLLVIFAAFETTSTTLHLCLYLLAKHPDIQEKVLEEIERVVTSDTPTHEELSQLTYTEQVINETLRLYPPAPIITRKAAETRTYGDITIPKGAGVMIPIYLVLKNPKYFPDPEKFDPERFSEENKAQRDPIAFMPFGYGPRLCIGMRLAYLELKIALVHLLRKLRFELNENTVPKKGGEEIKLKPIGLLVVEDPIKLAVRLR